MNRIMEFFTTIVKGKHYQQVHDLKNDLTVQTTKIQTQARELAFRSARQISDVRNTTAYKIAVATGHK